MPKLESLTVRGFKSIRELEDFEVRSLNILIGANGAGKSNLLSLFHMLERLSTDRLQLFIKDEGGSDALLFNGRRHTSSISVGLIFDSGQYQYQFSLEPVADTMAFANEWLLPGVAEFIDLIAPGTSPSISHGTTWRSGYNEARLANIGRGEFASYVLSDMKRWRLFHFQDVSPVAQVRLPSPVRDNLSFKPDAGNLGPLLRHLCEQYPDHYRRIVETVQLAAPFFGGFAYRKDVDENMELEWFQANDPDTVLGPRQLSDGTLRFICLTTLLLQPAQLQPELILIDEPELGLHPYALTLLAEMLQQASDARQLIVSTQSADLVSELDPEDVVVVDRKDEASTFERLDEDDLSDWLEDYSLGELWKMNIFGGRPGG